MSVAARTPQTSRVRRAVARTDGRFSTTKIAAVCVALMMLSGCGSISLSGGAASVRHAENDKGDVELVLDPVDLWDAKGLGKPFRADDIDKNLQFRKRNKELLERAWVRLGLFWHSRRDDIVLTAVIYQPSVTIRQMTLLVNGKKYPVLPAQGFNFTPPKGLFDKDASAAAFSLPPTFLYEIVAGGETSFVLDTNRGTLRVNLSAVVDDSPQALRRSANYLFAEFARKQRAAATR